MRYVLTGCALFVLGSAYANTRFGPSATRFGPSARDVFVPSRTCAYSQDERYLAVVGSTEDGRRSAWLGQFGRSLLVLDLRTGKDVAFWQSEEGIGSVAFSPCKPWVAYADVTGRITIRELTEGKVLAVLYGDPASRAMGELLFSPDGRYLVSVHEHSICHWDLASGYVLRHLSSNRNLFRLRDTYGAGVLVQDDFGVRLISYSGRPLGPYLQGTSMDDKGSELMRRSWYDKRDSTIHVLTQQGQRHSFNPRTGKQVGKPRKLSFSIREYDRVVLADEKRILIARYPLPSDEQDPKSDLFSPHLLWIDASTEKILHRFTLPSGFEWVHGAPSSRSFSISSSESGELRAMQLEAKEPKRILTLKPRPKSAIALSEHGGVVAFADREMSTIDLWQADPNQHLATLKLNETCKNVALSGDGAHLAVLEEKGMVHVWARDTKQWQRPFGPVTRQDELIGSPDGETWAVRDAKRIEVWSAKSGKRIFLSPEVSDQTDAWALSANGHWLAMCDPQATLRLWDLRTGRCTERALAESISMIQFAPKGDRFATCDRLGMISIWDASTCRRRLCFFAQDEVRLLGFSPSGECLWAASCIPNDSPDPFGPPLAERLLVWSTKNGKLLRECSLPLGSGGAFSPCSEHERFAMMDEEGLAQVMDLTKLKYRPVRRVFRERSLIADYSHLFPPKPPPLLPDVLSELRPKSSRQAWPPVSLPVFSPDGKLVAVGMQSDTGAGVCLYEAETGRPWEKRSIRFPQLATAITFSPDSRRIAVACGSLILVWELVSGKQTLMIDTQDHPIRALAYSPDGKSLASAAGKVIRVWNEQGKEVSVFEGHRTDVTALHFAADGTHLLSASRDGSTIVEGEDRSEIKRGEAGTVRGWDLKTRASLVIGVIPKEGQAIPLRFSFEGYFLLLHSPDFRSRRETQAIFDLRNKKMIAPFGPKGSFAKESTFLAATPDGRAVLTAGYESLRIQDTRTAELQELSSLPPDIAGLTFSPDGKRVAMLVKVRHEVYALQCNRFPFPERGPEIGAMALLFRTSEAASRHRRQVVVGNRLGQVTHQDFERNRRRTWHDHSTSIRTVAISKNERYLASGDEGGLVLVRETVSGRIRFRITVDKACVGLTFAEADRELIVVTIEGVLHRRSIVDGSLIQQQRMSTKNALKVSFSPESTTTVVTLGEQDDFFGAERGQPILWDWKARKKLPIILDHEVPHLRKLATRIEFSSDGKRILCRSIWEIGAIGLGGSPWRTEVSFERCTGREIPSEVKRFEHGHPGEWQPLFPREQTKTDWARLWKDLGEAQVFSAELMMDWVTDSKGSLAFLRNHLPPAPLPEPKTIRSLIRQLDNRSYRERNEASASLIEIGEQAAAVMREALTERPTLEMRRRLEAILEKIETVPLSSQQVLAIRVTSIVENIGNAEAKKLLEHWATGAPNARLTLEAKASLHRLKELK